MDKSISEHEIIAMLEWYKVSGVDEAVIAQPSNWFAWQERQIQPARSSRPALRERVPVGDARGNGPGRAAGRDAGRDTAPAVVRSSPTTPPDQAVLEAREIARSAQTMDDLEKGLRSFEACGLSKTATNLCFYRGSQDADIMVIGDAPGREDDIEGKPFIGEAGALLDKMLGAIDLDETAVHITNVIYWRPPGNRTPTPQEIQICQPFLARQLELVSPKIVVCLGGTSAKAMLNSSEGIMRIRGKWRDFKYSGKTISAMAILHPTYLLRTPAAKRLAWSDLLSIRAKLNDI